MHHFHFLNESQGNKQLSTEKGSADFPVCFVANLIVYKHAALYSCGHEGRACSEVILGDEFTQCMSFRAEN